MARQAGRVDRNPEVLERPVRRRFSAEYKERIVREAEDCTQSGQIGALLRREGLYSSHLDKWRRKLAEGGRAALAEAKRGRKPKRTPVEVENEALRKRLPENAGFRPAFCGFGANDPVSRKRSRMFCTVPFGILKRSAIMPMDWPSSMRAATTRLRRSIEVGLMPTVYHRRHNKVKRSSTRGKGNGCSISSTSSSKSLASLMSLI